MDSPITTPNNMSEQLNGIPIEQFIYQPVLRCWLAIVPELQQAIEAGYIIEITCYNAFYEVLVEQCIDPELVRRMRYLNIVINYVDRVTHCLKTWPEYFELVLAGIKTFELRKNDREFKLGDTLLLQEFDPAVQKFTGRSFKTPKINRILKNTLPGLEDTVFIFWEPIN
jgi:ASC-1-like (ASCH) protein